MRTKIEHSSDEDFNYWNVCFEVTSAQPEEDFEKLSDYVLENFCEDVQASQCPWEYEGAYGDSFSVRKEDMLKGEFIKEFRRLIKLAKKN